MTINLTPEQERRLQAVLSRGAYESVEEVVDAALAAVEQRTLPGFAGMPDELDDLLAEGLASKELKDAVRRTVESLRQHPRVGARYRLSAPQLHNLRSWPVAGFEAIRIYYLLDREAIHVIRVRHGKRDLKRILERERTV